jgi:hypothetical protein
LPRACSAAMTSATTGFSDASKTADWARALATATEAAKTCQEVKLARDMLDTMRADAAYRAGDMTGVLTILKSPGVDNESAFWLQSRFIEIAAIKKLGLVADFLKIRDDLVAATERNLTTGAQPYMVKVERFETDYTAVDAYEEVPRGRSLREIFFLASPKDGSMPISISVSFRMHGNSQGQPLGYMDMTYCQGNDLMMTKKGAHTYADLKSQAVSALDYLLGSKGASARVDALAALKDGPKGVCPQASYIFRGLTPD